MVPVHTEATTQQPSCRCRRHRMRRRSGDPRTAKRRGRSAEGDRRIDLVPFEAGQRFAAARDVRRCKRLGLPDTAAPFPRSSSQGTEMVDTETVVESQATADLPGILSEEGDETCNAWLDDRVAVALVITARDGAHQHIRVGITRGALAPIGVLQFAIGVVICWAAGSWCAPNRSRTWRCAFPKLWKRCPRSWAATCAA
jgi:hypothetical protein